MDFSQHITFASMFGRNQTTVGINPFSSVLKVDWMNDKNKKHEINLAPSVPFPPPQ